MVLNHAEIMINLKLPMLLLFSILDFYYMIFDKENLPNKLNPIIKRDILFN
jgi:hypothetical protein